MTTAPETIADPLERERMIVVSDGSLDPAILEDLRGRYPAWSVSRCDTYLSAIATLADGQARAVLGCVDPSLTQLGAAIVGLREAAGPDTKLVLFCTPESEPLARRVVDCGADDYILYPFETHELDAAIGYGRPQFAPAPAASVEELVQLGAALASIGERPMVLLGKLASLVRTALGARSVTVVVEGAAATAGDAVTRPVLSATLPARGGSIGQLMVGERVGAPYTAADVERLNHYATIAGHVLQAAARQRQWRELAVTDECSGLPNRRYLHERLRAILQRAAEEHFPVTVLLFDIDDFKTYNDAFGHDAGDEIIRTTGELFRRHCREQDVVTRYGGDEFAVVFWDSEGPREAGSRHLDTAFAVLTRFTEALRSQEFPHLGRSGQGCLTISGGLATYPWDGQDAETLLTRADQALLAAKRAGKNRIFLIGDAAGMANGK